MTVDIQEKPVRKMFSDSFLIYNFRKPNHAERREKKKKRIQNGSDEKIKRDLTYEQQMERVEKCGQWVCQPNPYNGALDRHQEFCHYAQYCDTCRKAVMNDLMLDYLQATRDIGGQLYTYEIALPKDEWNKIRARLKKAGLMYAKIDVNENEYQLVVASVGKPQPYKMNGWIDVQVEWWQRKSDIKDLWFELLTYSGYGKRTGSLVNYRKHKEEEENKKRISQIAEVGSFEFVNEQPKYELLMEAYKAAVKDTEHYRWYAHENLDGLAKAIEKRSQAFAIHLHRMGIAFIMHWKEIRIYEDELGHFT